MGRGSERPGAVGLGKSPTMLEGPCADWHEPDVADFLLPGWNSATTCGKELQTVGSSQLAPPPVWQEYPVSLAASRFHHQ